MKNTNNILESVDAFNEEVRMFKELEYEFFQEQEQISRALTNSELDDSSVLGNKTQEAYNMMLGAGFELLLHGLNYDDYHKLMQDNLLKIDEGLMLQLRSLSMITKEKMVKYNLIKSRVRRAVTDSATKPQKSKMGY